jgi:hypothetical protein
MDVAARLQGLGLERYVRAFRDNEIDWELFPSLVGFSQIFIGAEIRRCVLSKSSQ